METNTGVIMGEDNPCNAKLIEQEFAFTIIVCVYSITVYVSLVASSGP